MIVQFVTFSRYLKLIFQQSYFAISLSLTNFFGKQNQDENKFLINQGINETAVTILFSKFILLDLNILHESTLHQFVKVFISFLSCVDGF